MKYLKDIVTLQLDRDKCIGCGMCVIVCPHAVFLQDNGKVDITERDLCMECGACSMNCPTEAIKVDVGVGCASAIIIGAIKGEEPSCDCAKGC